MAVFIEAIRRRHNLATHGPWHWEVFAIHILPLVRGHLAGPDNHSIIMPRDATAIDVLQNDADFIAHAWKDVKDLLTLIDANILDEKDEQS